VNDFSDALRQFRNEHNLTRRELALRTGYDHTTISKIEAGQPPDGKFLEAMGREFGAKFNIIDMRSLQELAQSDPIICRLLRRMATQEISEEQMDVLE
jgi:transcriptional regulator with XRE-family HTH domain